MTSKKNSENDKSTGHFQSFFSSLNHKSKEKDSRKSTNKKFWP